MNIDDEIKKLDEERDGLLAEITKKRNRVNELARKIRSLETVKRHASEILEGDDKTLMITGNGPSVEDEIKDPAQLDIEMDTPEIIKDVEPVRDQEGKVIALDIVELPDYKQATKKAKERERKQPIEVKETDERAPTPFEKAIKEVAAQDAAAIDDFLKS